MIVSCEYVREYIWMNAYMLEDENENEDGERGDGVQRVSWLDIIREIPDKLLKCLTWKRF